MGAGRLRCTTSGLQRPVVLLDSVVGAALEVANGGPLRCPLASRFGFINFLGSVTGSGCQAESRVDDAALSRRRRPAQVQCARAVYGDIASLGRQRDPRKIEVATDASRDDVGPMRASDNPELAALPVSARHGYADGEPTALPGVASERTVLVPRDI